MGYPPIRICLCTSCTSAATLKLGCAAGAPCMNTRSWRPPWVGGVLASLLPRTAVNQPRMQSLAGCGWFAEGVGWGPCGVPGGSQWRGPPRRVETEGLRLGSRFAVGKRVGGPHRSGTRPVRSASGPNSLRAMAHLCHGRAFSHPGRRRAERLGRRAWHIV